MDTGSGILAVAYKEWDTGSGYRKWDTESGIQGVAQGVAQTGSGIK